MARKSTATKVKDLTNYSGEVAVYELSKAYKKDVKFVVVSKARPRSGSNWVSVFAADDNGVIANTKPLRTFGNIDIEKVFSELGYNLK